ncbi:hypothetical protein D3C76_1828990 [compost metagenome]
MVIVAVYINETITFAHLCRGGAHQVYTTPRSIPHHFNSVFDGLSDLNQVIVQVLDPVIIVNSGLAIFTRN